MVPVVDTVDGVVHIRHGAPVPEWTATAFVRIGGTGGLSADARPDEFGRIRAVAVGANGAIYVADAQSTEIRMFATDGTFVRAIGREGRGPGEMASAYGVGWVGDTLATLDPGNARVNLYTPDGAPVGHTPWAAYTGDAFSVRIHPGGFVPMPSPGTRAWLVGVPRVAGFTDTTFLDLPPENDAPSFVRCTYQNGVLGFYPIPHAHKLHSVPRPTGGVASAWSSAYEVDLTDPSGRLDHVVYLSAPTYPLTDREWNAAFAERAENATRYGPGDCTPNSPDRPETRALIHGLHFDHVGRLIVERNTAEATAYDLFDVDRTLRGTVPAPPHWEGVPPYFRDDRLYVVELDSLDVPRVVGYRLEPPPAR